MSLEHPCWFNGDDQRLYDELFYHKSRPWTEQEENFCKTMYHFEEYASGLDGDRE